MDQDTMVNPQTDSGKRLIDALEATGFDVPIAFWAKPTESGKGYFYLASPAVDEKGLKLCYNLIFDHLDSMPDIGIDAFEVKLYRMDDSLTTAALALRDSRRFRGMIRYDERTLAGISFDWVYFYPPLQPVPSV